MIEIRNARPKDASELADLFIGYIDEHREYISHGEIQMGVGEGVIKDGHLEAAPARLARAKWLKYINSHIEDSENAHVWKAVDGDEVIVGFCVADIQEDGDEPFGMVCDVLVRDECRGKGVGGRLVESAVAWLRDKGVKGIYLESGKNNHAAHRFFEKRGFCHVSEIYKLA